MREREERRGRPGGGSDGGMGGWVDGILCGRSKGVKGGGGGHGFYFFSRSFIISGSPASGISSFLLLLPLCLVNSLQVFYRTVSSCCRAVVSIQLADHSAITV